LTASTISRNDTSTGTSKSGMPWRVHASTRSGGTEPKTASPAPMAVTLAAAHADANASESPGPRRHTMPVSTISPPAR
jgi:hypothetical protein